MRRRAARSKDKEILNLPVQRIIRRVDGRCLFWDVCSAIVSSYKGVVLPCAGKVVYLFEI